ncbi:hypothetical protein ACH5RR_012963 [Cinchona calisaya]|uniref:Ribulose bisphosphate carboxylase large chain n=1 Tax=Cinchona calisaya TaxID=153742 RepID=A0ABD3A0W3_9GENT
MMYLGNRMNSQFISSREAFLSPQIETKASVGFKARVKEYKLTYYTLEYETKATDILAAFRQTPQLGVPPEEAGAMVATESSTSTWTTVWTDGLTSLDPYKGRCYHIKPVPGEEDQYIAYVAYPLDLFEEGSVTNMFTSIVGNVFGFKALRALRLEYLRIPTAYIKTFQGPPHGIQVERHKLNKYGRPLLGCTIKPKLSLSAKNYGRAIYECLRGGLDFTKDDENVNSQPFMHWRDCFLFCAEAIYKAQAETIEIKGHYLNATASTREEMIKIAVFARELGVPIVMLTKALHLSGGDHIHAGTVVGKPKGERGITLGFVDLLRNDFIEKDQTRNIYFTQDWVSLLGVLPVVSGGIHIWHMPALTEIFEDDSVLQFDEGTSGHPWGIAPGAVANRACDLATKGNEIIREASKWSLELAAACEVIARALYILHSKLMSVGSGSPKNRQDQESSLTDLALMAKLGNEEVQANSKMSPDSNYLSLWPGKVGGYQEGNRSKIQQSKNKLGYRKVRILPPTLRQPCGDITNWMQIDEAHGKRKI